MMLIGIGGAGGMPVTDTAAPHAAATPITMKATYGLPGGFALTGSTTASIPALRTEENHAGTSPSTPQSTHAPPSKTSTPRTKTRPVAHLTTQSSPAPSQTSDEPAISYDEDAFWGRTARATRSSQHSRVSDTAAAPPPNVLSRTVSSAGSASTEPRDSAFVYSQTSTPLGTSLFDSDFVSEAVRDLSSLSEVDTQSFAVTGSSVLSARGVRAGITLFRSHSPASLAPTTDSGRRQAARETLVLDDEKVHDILEDLPWELGVWLRKRQLTPARIALVAIAMRGGTLGAAEIWERLSRHTDYFPDETENWLIAFEAGRFPARKGAWPPLAAGDAYGE